MNNEQAAELRKLFSAYDTNGKSKWLIVWCKNWTLTNTDVLSTQQLRQVFDGIGLKHSKSEIQSLLEKVCYCEIYDGKNWCCFQVGLGAKSTFNVADFLRIVDYVMEETSTAKFLDECFEAFDCDGDGFVSAADLAVFNSKYEGASISEEMIEAMIKDGDENKDGKVWFIEFSSRMILNLPQVGYDEFIRTIARPLSWCPPRGFPAFPFFWPIINLTISVHWFDTDPF